MKEKEKGKKVEAVWKDERYNTTSLWEDQQEDHIGMSGQQTGGLVKIILISVQGSGAGIGKLMTTGQNERRTPATMDGRMVGQKKIGGQI
jgi:hypothetical protein